MFLNSVSFHVHMASYVPGRLDSDVHGLQQAVCRVAVEHAIDKTVVQKVGGVTVVVGARLTGATVTAL